MHHDSKKLDTSSELLIQRFGNGIKLTRPEQVDSSQDLFSVGDMLNAPLNVFFLNHESEIKNINSRTVESAGFLSIKEAIDKTSYHCANKTTANFEINHDRCVLMSEQVIMLDEDYERKDGLRWPAINIKYPWYNKENKLIGVFGCCIILDPVWNDSVAKSMSIISQANLLTPLNHRIASSFMLKRAVNNIYLTKRENEVGYLLLRGKTAREIGKVLKRSHRTIEHIIENMKIKIGSTSKSDLIEKLINHYQLF